MSRSFGPLFALVFLCIFSGCGGDAGGSTQHGSKRRAEYPEPGAADSGTTAELADASVEVADAGPEPQPSAAGSGGTQAEAGRHAAGSGGRAGEDAPEPPRAGAGGTTHSAEAGRGGAGAGAGTGGTAGAPEPAAGQGGAGAGGTAGGGQGGGGSGGSPEPALCTGPMPAASALGATPAALDPPSPGLGAPDARTNPGAAAPRYRLEDFQPLSCGSPSTYGLEAFRGRPTLVALFASWCPYCQSQVGRLESMALELEEQGKSVYIVVVNISPKNSPEDHDPIEQHFQFVDRVTFPLLQDTDEVDAWALHGGFKDDLFIYRSDGTLQVYLPSYQGTVPIDLTTPEGYAAVQGLLAGTP